MIGTSDMFVGRAAELAVLAELAADAADGRPRIALIEGTAGSGKSALLATAHARLDGFATVRLDSEDGAAVLPMWVIEQAVANAPTAPFAAGMALLALLADRQADGPVALVVEDLHWSDSDSRGALIHAFQRLQRGDRVLGLVTARSEEPLGDDEWRRLTADTERCRTIRLGPLSAAEVGELARRSSTPINARAAQALQLHTSGHPLYLRTLLRELTSEQLEAAGPLPAPRSLAAATVARVASLPRDAVDLLAALAVLGGAASAQLLGDVAGVSAVSAAIDAATSSGVVEVDEGSAIVRFVHPLHRVAVYQDLGPLRRRALHLAAATATPDRVGALRHRIAAADHSDDALAGDLEAAATDTVEASIAGPLLVASADLSSEPREAARRVLRAAHLHADAGDVAAVRRLYPRLEACPDVAERDVVLGWLAWQLGDARTAERWLRSATAGVAEHPVTTASAFQQLGAILALQSRGAEAIAAADAALATGALSGPQEETVWLTRMRGVAQASGGRDALDLLTARHPDPWDDAPSMPPQLVRVRAVLHSFAGEPVEAIGWFDAVLGSPRLGEIHAYLAHLHMMRAQCHHRVGSWDDALVDAHRAIDLATDLDQRWVLPQAHAIAARVQSGQGQHDAAAAHLAATGMVSTAASSFEAVVLVSTARAAQAHAAGDATAVAAALAPVFADAGAHLPRADSLQCWPMYIDALIDEEQLGAAERQLAAFRSAAADRRLDVRMTSGALTARLDAAAGHGSAAAAAFDEAVACATRNSDVIDHALLLHRHGQLLRSLGQRARALDLLTRGRVLFAMAHAAPYVARIDQDLTEAGLATAAEPRRSRFDLTERERDVAALVVKGLTNKEVAGELYVSSKAIEYHLGNIYAKLAVGNRRELREALTPA